MCGMKIIIPKKDIGTVVNKEKLKKINLRKTKNAGLIFLVLLLLTSYQNCSKSEFKSKINEFNNSLSSNTNPPVDQVNSEQACSIIQVSSNTISFGNVLVFNFTKQVQQANPQYSCDNGSTWTTLKLQNTSTQSINGLNLGNYICKVRVGNANGSLEICSGQLSVLVQEFIQEPPQQPAPPPGPSPAPTPSPLPTPTPNPTPSPLPAPTPQPAPNPTPNPTPGPLPTPTPTPTAQLKNLYFGYFADGMKGVGTGNYLSETSSRSNVHFISEEPLDYSAWKQKLNLARANNNQVIIMVQHVVYPWGDVIPHANAAERFATFYKEIESYKDIIIGYYLFDEPYWNNDLRTTNKKTLTEVYDGLQKATQAIKSKHSEAKVILTFAYPEIALNIKVPTAVDWVGINCYYDFGDNCTEPKIDSMVNYIKQNMSSEQKFVLTLDGYKSTPSNDETTQRKMIDRIKFWLRLTQNLPVAAYFPFIFQDQPAERLYGAKGHPILLNFLDQLFNKINSNPQMPHNSIAAMAQEIPNVNSCVVQEPVCEGLDSVRRDSCGKELDRWVSAPVCSTVKCEGLDYVRRNGAGQIVEIWKNAPICPH
jgi:hypothetical protein